MADQPKTKGMVALVPATADAERLAVEGGLAVDELHLTLLFLGDAADWGDADRASLTEAMRSADLGQVIGEAFSVAVFNPASDERPTCLVLGVGGQAVEDAHSAVLSAASGLPVPEQHAPWVAHVSLIYTDDLARIASLIDRCGPITFDRLRVRFADTHTDIPLSGKPVVAEARPMNPFLRNPSAYRRTPLRAESPAPKTSDDGAVTLRLYDPLDSYGEEWGVSAKEFVNTLDALPEDTTEIRLLINSPGGEVWQGLAILNALRSHPAKVIAVVEGIAASAASFIAAGADELHMMQNARLFVHRAWGGCIGNAVDMQKMAADLTHEDRNLASIYAGKSGGDVDEWLQVMTDETYYSAEEAVEVGLADRVVKPKRGSADPVKEANNRFDLSVFARRTPNARATTADDDSAPDPAGPDDTTNAPEPTAPAPVLPAAEPEPNTEPKEDPVSDLSEFRSRLGLDDTADEAAILAALDARLQSTDTNPTPPEPDTEPTPTPVPAPTPEPTPQPTPAPQASEASDELRTELARVSAELAEIRAREAAAVKASVIDGAVKAGKIKPAERKSWENRYDQAPTVITDVLNSIAAGTAVPVAPAGYTGNTEASGDLDAEWEREMSRLDGPTAAIGGN